MTLLLERAGFSILGEFDGLDQVSFDTATAELIDLFLIDTPAESISESWVDQLYVLCRRFNAARFALLGSHMTSKWFSVCLHAGIQGYLSKDREAAIFSRQIDLILAGERVYPLAAVREFAIQGNLGELPGDAPLPAAISPSEVEVLQYLLSGFRNKMIAHKLNIRESAVKLRVKSVFQKIHAVNRTQAAVWALNHGIFGGREAAGMYGAMSHRASAARTQSKKSVRPQP